MSSDWEHRDLIISQMIKLLNFCAVALFLFSAILPSIRSGIPKPPVEALGENKNLVLLVGVTLAGVCLLPWLDRRKHIWTAIFTVLLFFASSTAVVVGFLSAQKNFETFRAVTSHGPP